ncbi:DUF397 domain-containing protein [Streptomyces sp. BI20]|uniref:DUF397 domain-containing protein n=1 Tax=Streptomyces sp. BI20 TaxID=3403460 RepID=UPI003C732D2F
MAVQQATCSGQWFKSSYSGERGGDCVEACFHLNRISVRDSKRVGEAGDGMVAVSAASWEAFARYIALQRRPGGSSANNRQRAVAQVVLQRGTRQ